jgi:hypothetical protein
VIALGGAFGKPRLDIRVEPSDPGRADVDWSRKFAGRALSAQWSRL